MRLAIFIFLSSFFSNCFAQGSSTDNGATGRIMKIKDAKARMDSLYSYARAHISSQPEEALRSGKMLLEQAQAANAGRSIADADYTIASAYQKMDDAAKSMRYYLDAFEKEKEIKEFRMQINTLLNISFLCEYIGDLPKELQYVKEAWTICRDHAAADTQIEKMQPHVLNELATAYEINNNRDSALKLYKIALQTTSTLDTPGMAAVACNYAIALKVNKDYAQSLAAYNKALEYTDTGNYYLYAVINDNMALLFYEMGDIAQSEARARLALALEDKAGEIIIKRDAYGLLKKIYAARHDYQNALVYADSLATVKDTMYNKESSRQIKDMQAKYDTETKDKQIAIQDREIANNRKINFSLVLISMLLLGIGLLAYRNERKTKLLNTRITSQKMELEKLHDVKDRIFSVIGHDMRAPVNSLLAFTQLLENGNIPPEKMQLYSVSLKNNLGYTAGLMENLLSWARAQMDGYKPVPAPININELAVQAIGLLQGPAQQKNITISNQAGPEATALADKDMASLLLRNLISNAVKYTHAGGCITIAAAMAGNRIKISVADTGIGMPAASVDAFNKASAGQPVASTAGTAYEKGTGLGLMLCKSFAALMDGYITLESEQGKGSVFTVYLPATTV